MRGDQLSAILDSAWAQTALALTLALALRLWLIASSRGMMDGDEASLGILAEDILRGQFPVYFPGQNYMGAWDAYLMAPLISLLGPSALIIRAVTTVESLALVPVMGELASRLFGARARLPGLLLTAIPPVYVGVTELRMLGGYVETLLIGSLLTLVALSIAERWRAGRSARWLVALAGLLTGLGFWIDTLVVAYVLGVALWLAPLALVRARRSWGLSRFETLASVARTAAPTMIAFTISAAPALYSPQTYAGGNPLIPAAPITATTHWQPNNVTGPLAFIPHSWLAHLHFGYYFLTTALPEVIGSRLAYPPLSQRIFGVTLGVVGGLIVVGAVALLLRAVGWPRPLAALIAERARWNVALPVVLGAVILGGYLARKLFSTGVVFTDEARYILPLTTPLILALAYSYVWVRNRDSWGRGIQRLSHRIWPHHRPGAVIATALLLLTLTTYSASWLFSNPVMALRSPFNDSTSLPGGAFPADEKGLVTYLDQQHIHDIWANHWIGDVVMFLTDQRTLSSDYVDMTFYSGKDRFPQATDAVAHADRASFIVAWNGPGQPLLASALNNLAVRYTSARFGRFWVFTPLTRTVFPQEVAAALKQSYW